MDPKTRYEKERSDGKQQRLSIILEAAERVFTLKGIEKTTMQDIASDANIGIATLFRYFPKKEKLIVAVATKLLEPMLDRFQYVADLPLTCLEKLESLFDFFIVDHNNVSIKFMVDFESYASHSSEPLEDILNFNSLNRKISREYARIIQNGIEDGSIRSDLPVQETLTTVINTFGLFSKKLSLQKNILLLESDLENERQLAILKKIFIDYLKA
ncbi:TetR/AcrR family transcriptional regulator [Paenibacillus planticolens]|uniref:TetR family transcriptional regulator n=1 Tax=Paenibacillus planticolens TaxID=2654976 RepID=A0ABX1ZRJ8_9BACL|nr:TetR/AcrR family transcriptional regulator [Paenibacillus planticolens]NOV02687.1 TetR family transcriptional regulator [Paenibacillus planticolens]